MATNRGRTASSVGMMEGAFFVGRGELLQWANRLLGVNLTKVEQCANGCIYSQIIDSCHSGSVKMGKLNWMSRSDHEFVPNYKVLQASFDKNGIDKHIPVDMLIRAKYQDNLEMLQWMKCYWERAGARRDYDPVKAREGRNLPPWAVSSAPLVGGAVRADSRQEILKENSSTNRDNAEAKKISPVTRKPVVQKTAPAASGGAATKELQLKVTEQAEEIEELRSTLDGLESERDYYYKKLRDIEVLTTNLQADPGTAGMLSLISDVQRILYAEDVDEEGEDQETAEAPEPVSSASLDPLPFEGQEAEETY